MQTEDCNYTAEEQFPCRSRALEDIAAERQRQISVEGWNTGHDDEHDEGQLARAGACYAMGRTRFGDAYGPENLWPWDFQWWKPGTYRRNLVKAGALIAAEIERIDRAEELKRIRSELAAS